MFYLTTHSTHFNTVIWRRTSGIGQFIQIAIEETRLAARVLLYAPPQRQDSTYRGLCYTSWNEEQLNGSTMKDRSDDPSHHKRTLLPQGYTSRCPTNSVPLTIIVPASAPRLV